MRLLWTAWVRRRRDAPPKNHAEKFSRSLLVGGILWSLFTLAAIFAYVGSLDFQKIGLAVGIVFASGSVGSAIGFLFGIPKANPKQKPSDRSYEPNTNLEQVSDWLTKIILGVGLVQFRQIANALESAGQRAGNALGDLPDRTGSGAVFTISLMVASVVVAYQLTYMWTTFRLVDLFRDRTNQCSIPEGKDNDPGGPPKSGSGGDSSPA
jgi:hypothetical protein